MQTMPQERLNSLVTGKLQTFETLPEDVNFNAAKAWNKLEAKLQHKKTTSKAAWLIAATMVSIMMIGFWLLEDAPKPFTPSSKNTIAQNNVEILKVEQAGETPLAQPLQTGNKRTLQHYSASKHETKQEYVVVNEENKIVDNTPAENVNVTITQNPGSITNEIVAAPTSTPARKFRIVHNNESGVTMASVEKQSMAINNGFQFFKPNNVELSEPSQTDENILPIKRKDKGFLKTLTITSLKEN